MRHIQTALGTGTYRTMERNLSNSRIVIIGAGNVATHLARELATTHNILQIYSRDISNAKKLAGSIDNCQPVNRHDLIVTDADVYIIAVKDDAISSIAQNLTQSRAGALWLHTSGSVPVGIFEGLCNRYGVLYPLQTFSKDTFVNVSEVPFFIEGNTADTLESIRKIALSLSPLVNEADSSSRQRLHTAAVFACNFANHMWAIAHDILQEGGLDWETLMPLLKATLDKTSRISPSDAQTGPARRGDTTTMERHLSSLDSHQAEIYRLLSDSIMKRYNIY